MKKSLLALALFAFAGTAAFAQDGQSKDAKKALASTSPKSSCSMKGGMAASPSCCMKGKTATATASAKRAAKPVVVAAKIY